MSVTHPFGQWLQQRRKELGLSQAALAQEISCAVGTIKKLETGERRPSQHLAQRLATVLQITPDDRDAFLQIARTPRHALPDTALPPAGESATEPSLADRDHTNLPAPLTPLIGRETLVEAIVHQIRDVQPRLLTLSGPGGIGKTRLAVEVASVLLGNFPDGVWYVPLETVSQPHGVLPAIAQVLSIREAHDIALDAHLERMLSRKHLLLVLDTFEHVVTAAPKLIRLLQAAPKLMLLVTSRSVLRVSGEYELPVPPLALPPTHVLPLAELGSIPAVQLFMERAQAVNPQFVLTEEVAPSVVAICQQLDGLPLAIEIAAAQTKHVDLSTLAARLTQRLDSLTGVQRDRHPRQHSVYATLDWSYHLLTPAEQLLFTRLSVFRRSYTEAAVVAICMDGETEPATVHGLLRSLVDHSLVQIATAPASEARFSFLDTIHEYAAMHLAASVDHDTIHQRHAEYYVRLSEEARAHFGDSDRNPWLERLDRELPNIRSALQWTLDRSDGALAGRLMGNLCSFWLSRGYYSEGQRWCTDILAAPHSMPDDVRARVINVAGIMANEQADYAHAHACFMEALALRQKEGDVAASASSLNNLGLVAMLQGQYMEAQGYYGTALELYRQSDDAWGIALVLGNLGLVALYQDDAGSAWDVVQESLALRVARGDQSGIMTALNYLGQVARRQGQWHEARAYFIDSLDLSRTIGDRSFTSRNLIYLGSIMIQLGDYHTARILLADGLVQSQELGERQGIVMAIEGLAELEAACSHAVGAIQLFGTAAALREALRAPAPPHDHRAAASILAKLRVQVEQVRFDAAWDTGQGMTVADVVAFVVERSPH